MGGIRILRVKARALGRELSSVPAAPSEITLCCVVIGADQLGRLLQKSFRREDLRDSLADDVACRDPERCGGDRSFGIALQFDEHTSRLII